MEFNQPKGIYLQIADQVCDRILRGEWPPGERIPSIRELAVDIGVNPNTVTKSYQALVEQDVIENQRGLGYFVAPDAKQKILSRMRGEFIAEELPRLARTLNLLDMSVEELARHLARETGEQS